jgi:MoaA/NifB/PqqE/SkfB family radical SAM enzyme
MDRLQAIRDGKRPAPINAEIDLSNRCSLGCEWCHFAYTHTRGPLAKSDRLRDAIPGGDLMDTDLAKSIVRREVDSLDRRR